MCNISDKSNQKCQLNDCLFFSTTKLARIFNKIADEAFSITGLSPSHALLLYIVNQNGSIQQKEIGERMHLTPSTITRFIDKLERKNYVSRKTEGKNAFICTTEDGLALQQEIIKAWNNLHNMYNNILTEEETTQFISISAKLLNKLESENN